MVFNNNVYDVLKWIAQIVLPAIGALYFGLAQIWGLPYSEEIVGTITVIDVFIGAMLGISSNSYKGDGTVSFNPETGEVDLELEVDPDSLSDNSKRVVLNLIKRTLEEDEVK